MLPEMLKLVHNLAYFFYRQIYSRQYLTHQFMN